MDYEVAYFFGGGGGIGCGIYPGVFKEMEKHRLPRDNTITNMESVGAIMGTGWVLGYTASDMLYFMNKKEGLLYNFLVPKLDELTNLFHGKPLFPNHSRLEKVLNAFYGKSLRLKDVPNVNIYTADADTNERITLNSETHPNMYLNDAIISSSSPKGMFPPYMGMFDGGSARGSAIKQFLQENSARLIMAVTLMDHPMNMALNYLMNAFGLLDTGLYRSEKEKSEYLQKNPQNANIVHVGFKVPLWHFIDTSSKSIRRFRRLGERKFAEVYEQYDSEQDSPLINAFPRASSA